MTKPNVSARRSPWHTTVSRGGYADRAHIQHLWPTNAAKRRPGDSEFMKQALRGDDLTVYGDGKQTRSFCYVTDEIEGFLRLSKSDEHFPVNIGNPDEFTVLECAERVIAITGSKSKIRYEKPAAG